ncbi:MAG: hotdog fold thioesterase [Proteobacteria bacterium]|nr:hotdog fold thioesterase [Desulfobacula sp.]MBU3953040.1 hotdog fold thioesterase [Pseudomonadota bacterium]MBU4130402.1 hotdog fold thioesterase [Pseudomonadota bacterium]
MDKKTRENTIFEHIQKDAFANHLGARVEIVKPGHSRVSLVVTESMTNFHGTTHGGIIFSVSDIAFAAACNAHGRVAVALNVSIAFLKPSHAGDRLLAEAKEVYNGGRTSLYDIVIYNEATGEVIAKSQDQAYRMNQWIVPEQ